jgi:hypothetical protein
MPVPGAAASRDPVGDFQENIVAKKGPEKQGISSVLINFNLFLFNML